MTRRAPAIVFAGERWDADDEDPDDLLVTRPIPPGQTGPLLETASEVARRFSVSKRAALVWLAVESSTGRRPLEKIERASGLRAFAVETGLTELLRAGLIEPASHVAGRALTWRRKRCR